MGVDLIQNADGSASMRNVADGVEVLRLGGVKTASPTIPSWRMPKIVRLGVVGGSDVGGGLASFVNPEAVPILITRAVLDVVTPSTAACSVSLGTTTVSAATSSANLIDTLSVAAAGPADNITEKGTNGRSRQKLSLGAWVTLSTISGASAGLQGVLYLEYIPA